MNERNKNQISMKEEQIEKAARDLCTTDRQEQWFKDFGTACFADGARWRIEAAWHDVDDELPECGKHVVNEDWFDFIAKDEKDLQRIIKKYPFKLWAYVSDLLPIDEKEDAR